MAAFFSDLIVLDLLNPAYYIQMKILDKKTGLINPVPDLNCPLICRRLSFSVLGFIFIDVMRLLRNDLL